MGQVIRKNLDRPDERIERGWVTADVVKVAEATIARTEMRPGATCTLTGATDCPAHHAGLILSGRMRYETDGGSTAEFGPNDVFDVAPGHNGWVVGDEPVVFVNWSGFRTWMPDTNSNERVLLTLLFTDIVASTATAVRLGDAGWQRVLDAHRAAVRAILDRYRGREVATTGDGFLAAFDGAGRAISAASAIRDAARDQGIEVRQGVHTGEVELAGTDMRGVAVHEASRVAASAEPGEILVSATTQLLAVGAGIGFEDRGERELKGLAGPRRLFAAVFASAAVAPASGAGA